MTEVKKFLQDREQHDVAVLYEKFKLPFPEKPTLIEREVSKARFDFLDEEMNELFDSMEVGDLAGIIDALVDLVVVAKGTAVLMGVPWRPHWDEVHRANMQKIPGILSKRPGMPIDLVKPSDWVPPDHLKILGRHSW